jgi:pilus assembly protein CpaE
VNFVRNLIARIRRRADDACPGDTDDRGSSVVEFTILFPIIVLILFAAPQLAMWYFAREAAQDAAVAAARAAAVQNAPAGTGETTGDKYLADLDSGTISSYTVTEEVSATTITIHIKAKVPNVIPLPGFAPTVDVTVVRDRERFTTVDAP